MPLPKPGDDVSEAGCGLGGAHIDFDGLETFLFPHRLALRRLPFQNSQIRFGRVPPRRVTLRDASAQEVHGCMAIDQTQLDPEMGCELLEMRAILVPREGRIDDGRIAAC